PRPRASSTIRLFRPANGNFIYTSRGHSSLPTLPPVRQFPKRLPFRAIDPISRACSLDDEQLAARRAEWQAVAGNSLIERIDQEGGFTTTYRGDAETARALEALVQAELECCPDIGWNLEQDGELIRLR